MSLPPPSIPIIDSYITLCSELCQKYPNDTKQSGDAVLINMESKKPIGDHLIKLIKQQKLPYQESKIRSVPKVRCYINDRRQKAETLPLVGNGTTNSDNSESDLTYRKSRSESYSASNEAWSELSPRIQRPQSFLPPKTVSKVFKELMTTDSQYRNEIASVVREVMKEETSKLKNEIKTLMSVSVPLSFTPTARSNEEPIFSAPIAISTIKDTKVRGIISKNFPGGHIVTWEHYDTEGVVDGTPEMIVVDIIQKDTNYYILDLKEKVGIEEIATLLRVGKLFHNLFPDIALGCVVVYWKIAKQASLVADACKIRLLNVDRKCCCCCCCRLTPRFPAARMQTHLSF